MSANQKQSIWSEEPWPPWLGKVIGAELWIYLNPSQNPLELGQQGLIAWQQNSPAVSHLPLPLGLLLIVYASRGEDLPFVWGAGYYHRIAF